MNLRPPAVVHILVSSADPHSINGVNKVVHALATAEVRAGIAVEVWPIRTGAEPATHEHSYALRVFPKTRFRLPLSISLAKAIESLDHDTVIHFHSVFQPEFTAIAHRLKRRKLRFIHSPHGGYLSCYYDNRINQLRKAAFSRLWENWMLRNASFLHAIGKTEADDLAIRAPAQRIIRIPNGFDLSWIADCSTSRTETFVYCGRFAKVQKGLDLLLTGFAEYCRNGGKYKLTMIGSGQDEADLRLLARRLAIEDRLHWTGALYGTLLHQAISAGSAFVHTSRYDVFPTACLEAASLRIPLVVSAATNLEPHLNAYAAGWVFKKNQPLSIAEKLLELEHLGPDLLALAGQNARRMIEDELNWDILGWRHIEELERL